MGRRIEDELDRVWGAEAEHRYDEFLAGRAKAYPAEEVFKRIRARLKQARAIALLSSRA